MLCGTSHPNLVQSFRLPSSSHIQLRCRFVRDTKRISIAVGATATDEGRAESAQISAKDAKWKSVTCGGFSHQSGTWNQLPDGIHMREPTKSQTIVLLRACNCSSVVEGDSEISQ